MPRKISPDYALFTIVLALLGLGIVMVYSASAILAMDRFHDPYFFLKKQGFWSILGLGLLWGVMSVDYRRWRPYLVPFLMVATGLLILVLVPPFGQAINGTRRWIRWGPLSVQPTELAKIALVLYLADFLARRIAFPLHGRPAQRRGHDRGSQYLRFLRKRRTSGGPHGTYRGRSSAPGHARRHARADSTGERRWRAARLKSSACRSSIASPVHSGRWCSSTR